MASVPLDVLRAEHDELSKRLVRGAFIALILLVVMVLSFVRALGRLQKEIAPSCEAITILSRQVGTPSNSSWVVEGLLETCLEPADGSGFSLTPDERVAREEDLQKNVDKLEDIARTAFIVKWQLLGSNFDIDLSYWIALLPVVLWTAGIHLVLLHRKQAVICRLAEQLIHSGEGTEFDKLLFGGKATYRRYPMRLAAAGYVVTVVLLLLYLLLAMRAVRLFTTPMNLAGFELRVCGLLLILLISYYVGVYTRSIGRRIEREAAALIGSEAVISPSRLGMRLSRRLLRIRQRLSRRIEQWPRLVAIAANALVIASLFFTFGVSCAGEAGGSNPHKGYEILDDPDSVYWFNAAADVDMSESLLPLFGAITYASMLILAAGIIIAALISLGTRDIWLFAAADLRPGAVLAALFMLTEVAFVYPVAPIAGLGDVLRIVYFIVPAYFWLRYGRPRSERWTTGIRPALFVLYLPAAVLVPLALVKLIEAGFYGVVLCFAGTQLSALAVGATVPVEEPRFEPVPVIAAPVLTPP